MIHFDDVFKSSFLSNAESFSMFDAVIAIAVSAILGYIIFMVHKKTFRSVMYSVSFGLTLIAMTVITSMLILAVTSNVVLSLGMVGALSIVRFRTAIKEPLDIAFVFWSIAIGIVVGAGLIPLAVFGTVIIAVFFVITLTVKPRKSPYILVFKTKSHKAEDYAFEKIGEISKKYRIKSRAKNEHDTEFVIEIFISNKDTDIVDKLSDTQDIKDVNLVSYNGEYMS